MNGYVEGGYLVVTGGIGGYAAWLGTRAKKLRRAVVVVRDETSVQRRSQDKS
ncbi:MAG: hypothetical protein HKL82_03845 [Acidimicrobiaceae bacterium]|nr:hypothetical protein [Acidimicrobiaceae bacterium]